MTLDAVLRSAVCLAAFCGYQALAGEPAVAKEADPASNAQMPDCSVKAACLCPWRGRLSLDDFEPIALSSVPNHVLLYSDQELCEWHVIETSTGPKVFHARSDYRRDIDRLALPFAEGSEPWSERGRSVVIPTVDGYVTALDAGEWGAGVWWLSRDGRKSVRLGEQHVTDMLSTPRGVLATVDSSETDPRSDLKGRILLIKRDHTGGWQIARLARTVKPALTAALTVDGSVLVLTADSVLSVNYDGSSRVLHAGRWSEPLSFRSPIEAIGSFSPNSLVPLANGDILIGMNAAVVRLTQEANGYSETWYVPKKGPAPQ